MKRLLSILLILVVVVLLMAVPEIQAADADLDISGNLDSAQPTKVQIRDKWREVTYASSTYDEVPSVTAPYAAGKLTDNMLKSGITYLNYVRYVAHLPKVQLSDSLNEDAQYGAVLLAATDTLTHYPVQPDDMDDDFYERGYNATTSSNISAGYGSLQGSISGCMNDNSSLSNLACVGHRRWLLNPPLLNVGFGYAESESNWSYIVTKVFDKSGNGCDYDFISWPSSGNFPTNLFNTRNPWSVTVNPYKYCTPALNDLQITITRQSDGKKWEFDASTGEPVSSDTAYLTVENSRYGIPNCIIFHPGSNNVDAYKGVYTVDISGLYTLSGEPTSLHYQVDFFDVNAEDVRIVTQPKSVKVEEGETAKVTVEAAGGGLTYQWYWAPAGSSDFTLTKTFTDSTYSVKMDDSRNGRQVYCVITDQFGNSVKTDTVTLSMKVPLKIVTQPKTGYAKMGEKVKVTVKAEGDGLSYQWYIKNAGGSKYSKSSVASATYSTKMSDKAKDRYVYCVITDAYGNTAKTKTIVLREAVSVVTEPKTSYAQSGKTVKTKVVASGDGLTYQWYVKNAGEDEYTKSSVTSASYSTKMNSKSKGRRIYCVITDEYGNSVQTKTVLLRMAATITTQPKNVTAEKGKTVKTTVKAVGDGLTYQWYIKNEGSSKFNKSSATTATYSCEMSEKTDGRQVYCVVTDKYGKTAQSNTVTLTMK